MILLNTSQSEESGRNTSRFGALDNSVEKSGKFGGGTNGGHVSGKFGGLENSVDKSGKEKEFPSPSQADPSTFIDS